MSVNKNNKTGLWDTQFYYKDWLGNSKHTCKRGFKSKREAVEYEVTQKLKLSDDISMTFGDFVKLYREEKYSGIRVTTAINKDYIINAKLLPYFGDRRLNEIKSKDIVRWQNEMINFRDSETGKPYSLTYIKKMHCELSTILNYAVKVYGLKENVVSRVGFIKKQEPVEMKFWTLDEYRRFSKTIMDRPVFYYAFETLYWTGCRIGELLALTPSDINFEKKTLNINKSFHVIKGKVVIGPTKTRIGTRVISLPDDLCQKLKDYLDMIYSVQKDDRLFPLRNSAVAYALEKGCKKAGVKKIRVHDIRHSHVSLLINMGFDAVAIAKRVGHESIDITFRYAHMFPEKSDEMAEKLNVRMVGG